MIMILCYQFMNDFENVYFNLFFFIYISVYSAITGCKYINVQHIPLCVVDTTRHTRELDYIYVQELKKHVYFFSSNIGLLIPKRSISCSILCTCEWVDSVLRMILI